MKTKYVVCACTLLAVRFLNGEQQLNTKNKLLTKNKKIMKNLIIILLFPTILFAQKPMTEKQALEKSHIDFTKEYLFFTIHGLVEIDGHTFKNDTCKCPILYFSNLDKTTISDTCSKVIYIHRKCELAGCKIIHLIKPEDKKQEPNYFIQPRFNYGL